MADAADVRRESNHAADGFTESDLQPRPNQHQEGAGPEQLTLPTSDPQTWQPHIRERYGIDGGRSRRIASVIGAVALLLAPVGVWALWQAGRHDVTAAIGPYTLSDASARVELTYQTAADSTTVVTCALRAQDSRRIDVGYAYLRLAGTAGAQRTITYTLSTTAPAVAAELLGCQLGDDMSRLPAAQFPPGVKPPAQAPPGRAPSVAGIK
mgnify:CR=1 FL=1